MSTQPSNPFVFPGQGQGEQNPLLASMEMMRQAWQNMTSAGVFQQPVGPSALTTEQLDKRIADMRAVEGWLKLNLSMLGSSIQALEVQRATLGTLKSYMGFVSGGTDVGGTPVHVPSPLDVALGIKPSGQAKIKSAKVEKAAEKTTEKTAKGQLDATAPLADAAQAWWSLLQQQFNTLTAATAASMPTQEAAKRTVSKTTPKTVSKSPIRSKSSGTARKSAKPRAAINK